MDSSHLVYNFGGFSLDRDERVLRRGATAVPLTPKATEILLALVEQHGRIVEKGQLMERVWPDTAVEESNLSQNIYTLRKVLGELDGGHRFIETVARRGYRFVAPVEETSSGTIQVSVASARGWRSPGTPWLLPLGGVALASIFWYVGIAQPTSRRSSASPRTAETFAFSGSHVVPATSFPGEERLPSLSPDGKRLAFVWNAPHSGTGDHDLHVKPLDGGAAVRVTHSGDHSHSAWSPDGQRIAFVGALRTAAGARSRIATIPATGGAERTIWQGHRVAGLDWSPDGAHLVVASGGSGDRPVTGHLTLISSDGGELRRLTTPPAEVLADYRAAFSPNGQSIAFVRETREGTDLHLVPVAGGEPRRLTSGHRRISSVVWMSGGRRLVFSESAPDSLSTTVWQLDLAGGGEPVRLATTPEPAVDLAADRGGRRLAFTRRFHDTNIRRIDLSTPQSVERALVVSAGIDQGPAVSADARRMAFTSNRSGAAEIWVANHDGSEPRQLTTLATSSRDPAWSPDGRRVAFASVPKDLLRQDIYVIDADGAAARRLVDHPASDAWPFWSRDGNWIYFSSNRSESWQIWKVPAGGGTAVQVTTNGGLRGSESLDGQFLYYSKDPPAIWRMPANGGASTVVMTFPTATDWGGEWTVAASGIYFQVDNASPSAARLFRFATGQDEPLATYAGHSEPGGGFTVSPDGKWLLYTERTYFNVDIMVVDDPAAPQRSR